MARSTQLDSERANIDLYYKDNIDQGHVKIFASESLCRGSVNPVRERKVVIVIGQEVTHMSKNVLIIRRSKLQRKLRSKGLSSGAQPIRRSLLGGNDTEIASRKQGKCLDHNECKIVSLAVMKLMPGPSKSRIGVSRKRNSKSSSFSIAIDRYCKEI